jgi:hypothetical protein
MKFRSTIGLDKVEDRPKRPSELEALSGLRIALREIGIVKYENTGNIAVAPQVRRHGQMDLRRIQVRKFVEAKRSLVAVYTLGFLRPVARPECPKDEVGPIGHREQGESVDAAVLADPVPDPHVIGMSILSESGGFCLFGSEEALLPPGDLEEPPRCLSMRLGPTRYYSFLDLISNAARY